MRECEREGGKEGENERVSVCEYVYVRNREFDCWGRGRGREFVCGVCVCERERERMCVCEKERV